MTLRYHVRALRGATTADDDTRASVAGRVNELLQEMLVRNAVREGDVISVLFTATKDLISVFPATAARDLGFANVPLICAQELDIVGATPRALRIMMTLRSRKRPEELHHVYLHGAANLRDDLTR
jgi:chorismate mutase